MAGNLSDYSRKDLEDRVTTLEYALAELEHKLKEDSEEWEIVQDAKAPGWFTIDSAVLSDDDDEECDAEDDWLDDWADDAYDDEEEWD